MNGTLVSATREEPASTLRPKISLSYITGQLEPTVVRRTQCKSRPSIFSISPESMNNENNNTSSDSSGAKTSTPSQGQSTGKTSVDSKYNIKNARHTGQGSDPLATISETDKVATPVASSNQPSASRKIAIEIIHANMI